MALCGRILAPRIELPPLRGTARVGPHGQCHKDGAARTGPSTRSRASGEARIGMRSGSQPGWEMERLAEQCGEFGVPHRFSTEFDDEDADWNGEWLKEALAFIAADM